MTSTQYDRNAATDKQVRYFTSLLERADTAGKGDEAREATRTLRADVWHGSPVSGHWEPQPQGPLTKAEYSAAIDALVRLLGDTPRPYSRGRRGGYRSRPVYRCTHIDYPCCGCGPDAGR